MTRDVLTASVSLIPGNEQRWAPLRRELYEAIRNSVASNKVRSSFKGTILQLVEAFQDLGSNLSLDHVNDILTAVRQSTSESNSKLDLLKFDLMFIFYYFALDSMFVSTGPTDCGGMERSIEQVTLYLRGQLISAQDDSSIRSRKFKTVQKSLQGILHLFEVFLRDGKCSIIIVSGVIRVGCESFAELHGELSTWDNLLKSVYTWLKRHLSQDSATQVDEAPIAQSVMNLLRKISEEVDVVAKLKRDGNASPADVVNVLLHISLLFDGIRLGHGQTSALKAMMLWNMAILLEKSRSRGICSLGGADYFDKLNKCLHLSVAHYLNTTGAEMAGSTGTGVLLAAEEEVMQPLLARFLAHLQEAFRASASSVQAPGALPSSTTLIHLLSAPSSKMTKKLVDLIIDLLHCPESTEIEDLRLIRREMQFLLASTAPMMTTDRTLLQHALAWWTQDLNMGRYTAMKNEDYQALCLHDDVLRDHVSPVSVGASILDGNAPATGAEKTMALSIPALTIVHDLYHIWASPSDGCALLFDQDMAFSKDYQPIVDCVGVIQRHLHDARRWHRSLSSAVASCQPTPHWSDEAAKQTFLSGVESVMDHVKASMFQPFVDYYIVKSFLWLCASKVCWFYFDDLLTAEACAKKSFSYAHNRSIRDGPWTRWLRSETLLFSAEVAENLGKTSRAVDNVAEAWQLVTQLRGTSPTEPQVSPTALCIRVVVHVLRHWHRIESARLQELVTSLGVAGFNDEAATSTVAWLMNQYPTFQTKLSTEPTVMSAMQNTPSRPRRPEAFDVDILWQRSAMGWQDPTAAAAKGLNAAMPNEDAMLRFSLQCPFPVARHLRKAAAISLVQGDRGADSVRNLQAFVAGASAAFLTLERSSYLPTPSVPSSGSKVQCDQNPSVQLVQEALRSSSTSIDAVAQRLDLLVAQSSSSTQVAFLTCDVATDTILAGVYRHRGHRDVQVLSIAGGKALHALAHRWRNMLEAQHQQLRRTKDLAIVTQMTEKEKKQWWKQREQMEADIEAILVECETLLSPLLALLRAPVATDSGPSHDGDISEPLSTAEPHKALPTTTGAISATPSARSGVKKQPLGTGTALKAMTGHGGGGAGGGARGVRARARGSSRLETEQPPDDDDIDPVASSMKTLRFAVDDNDDNDEVSETPYRRGIVDDDDVDETAMDEFDRLVAATETTAASHRDSSSLGSPLTIPTSPQTENQGPVNGTADDESRYREEYEALKVTDLKVLCKEAGLPVAGKKSELIDRLVEHRLLQSIHTSAPAPPAPPAPPVPPATASKKKPTATVAKTAMGTVDCDLPPLPTPAKPLPLTTATPGKAMTTAKKGLSIAPMSAMATTTATKKKTNVLMTALKSAGKRVIDVFYDDDEDEDGGRDAGRDTSRRRARHAPSLQAVSIGSAKPAHTVLLVDEWLQQLPLESMASLRHAPVSRMISLPLLLDIIRRRQEAVSNEQEGPWWQPAEAKRTWYALDAENNLPTTRATLWPLLEEAQERWGWSGFVGQVPKPEVAK